MINAAGLKETFAGDSEIVLGLYDELKAVYGHDFLFWLQYGIAAIDAGHLDLAENYLKQSLAIRDNHQADHHMGLLQLLKATRGDNPVFEKDRAAEGIRTLQQQIYNRGDEDSYPFHAYLVHVSRWYAKAGKLTTDKEWEDLRAVGKLAMAKYGREQMVVDATREVERLYMLRAVVSAPPTTA